MVDADVPGELRDRVRSAVAARQPVDDREAAAIPAFLELFDALLEPFSEDADPVHVTGSAIVIGRRGVVLHKHKRLGLWLQPGGHIEPGETPWEGALRETVEETGLVARHPADGVRFVHVDVHAGGRGHTHLDLRYLLIGPDVDPAPPAGESAETYWFSWDEAIELADEGLRGALVSMAPSFSFSLRRAVAGDHGAVGDVYLRSRRFALPTIANAHTDAEVRDWIAQQLVPETEVWVAIDGAGSVVGMIGLAPGWIEQLYLDPAVIGLGLGERFVELAKQRNPDGLQLWAFQTNQAAQRFYARCGFAEAERTDGSGNEERAPDVRMTWMP